MSIIPKSWMVLSDKFMILRNHISNDCFDTTSFEEGVSIPPSRFLDSIHESRLGRQPVHSFFLYPYLFL